MIRQNLRYYSGYIDEAIRKGMTENAILDELGSPFLIARTILDSQVGRQNTAGRKNSRKMYGEKTEAEYREYHWSTQDKKRKWIAVGIIIGVLVLIITVLRFLLPVLMPVLLALLAADLIKRHS